MLTLRDRDLWNDMLETFDHEFDNFFDKYRSFKPKRLDPVNVSLKHDDKNYYIRAVVPGFTEDELKVEIMGKAFTISGKHEVTKEENEHYSSSRSSFSQTLYLGSDAKVDEVSAEHKDGILVVTVPRNELTKIKTKTVPIKRLKGGEKQ